MSSFVVDSSTPLLQDPLEEQLERLEEFRHGTEAETRKRFVLSRWLRLAFISKQFKVSMNHVCEKIKKAGNEPCFDVTKSKNIGSSLLFGPLNVLGNAEIYSRVLI